MTENRLKSRLLMGATLVGAKIIRVRDAWATRPVWVKMTEAVESVEVLDLAEKTLNMLSSEIIALEAEIKNLKGEK